MAYTWIKLYTEILDDPKMGRLPDTLWRRAIELFLLAGRENAGGALPSIEDMAWTLRLSPERLLEELEQLSRVNLVHLEDGRWVVTHFEARQSPMTSTERVKAFRKRARSATNIDEGCNDAETKRFNSCNENAIEEEVEEESEEESTTTAGARENSQTVSEEPPEEATDPEIGQIYREYEQNLGVLTPMIADQIDDLIEHYPRDWIPVAFREAVAHEARSLKYVEAILRRWKREGFKSEKKGTEPQKKEPKKEPKKHTPEELAKELAKKEEHHAG